jgi:hypothetical protein
MPLNAVKEMPILQAIPEWPFLVLDFFMQSYIPPADLGNYWFAFSLTP